jgi:hypothetical protein
MDHINATITAMADLARERNILIKHTTASSNRITAVCRGFILNENPALAAASVITQDMTDKQKAKAMKVREKIKTMALAMAERIKKGSKEGGDGHARAAIDIIARNINDVAKKRERIDADIGRLAKTLPIAPWVDTVTGFSHTQAGLILAETGNLSNYATPSRVWKRMGLAVLNGAAQRRIKGDDAIPQGYVPRRRAVMYMIEDTVLRLSITGEKEDQPRASINEFGDIYMRERAKREARIAAGEKLWKGAHYQARRIMGKELLRQMWVEWRRRVDMIDDIEQQDPWADVRFMQRETAVRHQEVAA